MPLFDQVIVWIVVGLIGGSLAGLLITWERRGSGGVAILVLGWLARSLVVFCFACWACFQGSTRSRFHWAISWQLLWDPLSS